ncbi:hypothetical protein Pcinc_030703 [Petrolisthes cinctipes]|uniref:Menorin-like domain-containing protein n=1 Tax=Petrolisthes cinctipes TaxID=88211 RepID=A0AAE1EYT5_PETCI|nr:hypothetical protein Pcinc_030703 [Petrolisthes cinctipes]
MADVLLDSSSIIRDRTGRTEEMLETSDELPPKSSIAQCVIEKAGEVSETSDDQTTSPIREATVKAGQESETLKSTTTSEKEEDVVSDKAELGNTVNVIDFFPEINDDLSLVRWAHGVNSHIKLVDSLNDPLVMMLEADVLAGTLEDSVDTSPVPIMAHPPDTESDLTLAMWIEAVIAANKEGKKKGVKLDFKDLSIVQESLKTLECYASQINFPLWLNADILPGPVDSTTTPLAPNEFLSHCVRYFPLATLSLGWTTRYTSAEDEKGEYTLAMLQEMARTHEILNIAQPVTFAIRACFVGRSIDALEWLIENVLDSTLTVWSAATDDFDPQAILTLQDVVGTDALYLDLPEDQMEALEEARLRGEEQQRKNDGSGASNILPITTITTAALALVSALAALYLYN